MIWHSSAHDRFARWLAGIGTLVSVSVGVVGLLLTVHWHRQEIEDKILVRVGAFQKSYYPPNSTMPKFRPKGKLDVEVVNIGMRPIYIQDVEIRMGDTDFVFYQYGPAATIPSDAMKPPLAPGQPTEYEIDWDFSEDSLGSMWREIKKNDLWVHVETTRKSFDMPVTDIYRSTDSFLNLEVIQPVAPDEK